MEILVKRRALLSALAGAKAAFPNEFICILTGTRERDTIIIEDTLIPPGIMVSEAMSSFSEWMLPVIDGMLGTFHSHPQGSARPSGQDRHLFSQKGGVNFIAAAPFGIRDVSCYLGNGKGARFALID